MEAIARRRLVEARYNGQLAKLAPHLLFERRGELYVSALSLSRNWRADEDLRLGQFKLAGLDDPTLTSETFDPLPAYEAMAPRADDSLVLTV